MQLIQIVLGLLFSLLILVLALGVLLARWYFRSEAGIHARLDRMHQGFDEQEARIEAKHQERRREKSLT